MMIFSFRELEQSGGNGLPLFLSYSKLPENTGENHKK